MIVAGFGFRSGASPESLRDAFTRAGGQADRFATLTDKAASDAFQSFAAGRSVTEVAGFLDRDKAQISRLVAQGMELMRTDEAFQQLHEQVRGGRGVPQAAPETD